MRLRRFACKEHGEPYAVKVARTVRGGVADVQHVKVVRWPLTPH